jgi:hypothetical protein
MKKYIILLALFSSSFFSFSQNTPPSNAEMTIRADTNYLNLKNGVLLVRLSNPQKKIAALRKYGYFEEANNSQMIQDNENKEIIKSFKDEFTFCKSYFFFSEHSNLVRAKDFSKPIFLDDKLNIDPSIKLTNEAFLIAEFGNVKKDPASYKDFYVSDSDNGYKKSPTYWGGPDLHFSALTMMSDQFIQLRRPFPRYARTFSSLGILKRSVKNTVIRLNKKLIKFGN